MIELLVILAVLLVVALLGYAVLASTTMRKRQAASSMTMKGIGHAIALYVADHGQVPGPTNTGQKPYFKSGLLQYIWPYLGRDKRPDVGEVLPEFVPAHWIVWLKPRQNPPGVNLYSAVCTFFDKGEKMILFGYLHDPPPHDTPGYWSALTSRTALSRQVALRDQPNSSNGSGPRDNELQNYTTSLYLDWHVEIHRNP